MKVLVTGSNGQLGYDVMKELKSRSYDAVGVDVDKMNITDINSVESVMRTEAPDAVIHCAAWTAVDLAEAQENRENVYNINVKGTENVAKICKQINCKMLYLSTDYVFDGHGDKPWNIQDAKKPLNYYGYSKYMGECAIERVLDKYFIVRVSWVFGINGKNFVKTMLNLGKTHDKLTVVDDQIGSPTYTFDLAKLLVDMIETDKYGVYHATNEDYCSWYDFACEIFRQASKYDSVYNNVTVVPINSSKYPSKIVRPSNSRLNKKELDENGFKRLPKWTDALERFIIELEI